MLAIEIMDDPFINSIEKYLAVAKEINSPYLFVYPDTGNVSAWHNDLTASFCWAIKPLQPFIEDTYAVTEQSKGQFRDVPFGQGCVNWKILSEFKRNQLSRAILIEMCLKIVQR